MNTAMIRKALLPVLAASAVLASTPALAQSVGVTLGRVDKENSQIT